MIVASTLWIGGAETVMRHLAHAINPRRFMVTVCHLKQRGVVGDELCREGVNIIGLPMGARSEVDYLSFLKLLKVIRAEKIEVLHTHTTHGLVDSCLCKLVMPRLRVVHTFHFGNYPHTRASIIWMERIFSRLADRLIAVGDIQRRQLQDLFGFSDRRIRTIWNGVRIRSGAGDPSFRRKLGAENCVLIGTIATLIQQKGLSDLLDVAKVIRDSGRKAVFVIVGEGHLRAELEAKQRELGLEGTVVLTGWVTNAADVALPTFDIFFQPSLWEAMSMVILEAMAAGKPVVATRVGENGQVIEDGVDGLLVQPRNVGEMAAALGRLIDDAALRVRLGEAARLKVEQRFTVEHMTNAYEAVYSELLR
ncbi:glycosyltransferase family 4 protein [Nitrospira sp. NS4]|uniref:glycosyltransferase family 4 protein n=1 Tax=Nitrospira sp. NS4 TaxID=3414498 RepID=UPI003C2CA5A0